MTGATISTRGAYTAHGTTAGDTATVRGDGPDTGAGITIRGIHTDGTARGAATGGMTRGILTEAGMIRGTAVTGDGATLTGDGIITTAAAGTEAGARTFREVRKAAAATDGTDGAV